MEAFPIPEDAIQLPRPAPGESRRSYVIQALQQALTNRRLSLSLGPETALLDDTRLLQLNQWAVQVNTAGFLADEVDLDLTPWREDGAAPQLSIAALVDLENDLVAIAGVCTNAEMQDLAKEQDLTGSHLSLDTSCFRGGLDRLLMLVQVLEPSAISRQALSTAQHRLGQKVIAISDWIQGQIDQALSRAGASLQPLSAGAFRSASVENQPENARALLSIPLGLNNKGEIVSGEAANICIEQFQLQLLPIGSGDAPEALTVRLCGSISGDLLPDGLILKGQQGLSEQTLRSSGELTLELTLSERDATVELAVIYGDAEFKLPALLIK
ncbi:MAG: Uncharacterised protein [Prochlorococcus marinus str. MIT 9215]|nr:MAG: Uncharacterised protein [Prochlorococcus marinus str. MIT 9215]